MTRTPSRFPLALLVAGAFGFAQPVAIQQQLTFTPYHSNGIYEWSFLEGL